MVIWNIYKDFISIITGMGSFVLKPCNDGTYKIIPHDYFTKGEMVNLLVSRLGAEVIADTKFISVLRLDGMKLSVSKKGEIMIREFTKEEDATRLTKKIMKALDD